MNPTAARTVTANLLLLAGLTLIGVGVWADSAAVLFVSGGLSLASLFVRPNGLFRRRKQDTDAPLTPEQIADFNRDLTTALTGLSEALEPIDEASQGYRARLEARGWSPAVAESLAAQYHALLMNRVANGGGRK